MYIAAFFLNQQISPLDKSTVYCKMVPEFIRNTKNHCPKRWIMDHLNKKTYPTVTPHLLFLTTPHSKS